MCLANKLTVIIPAYNEENGIKKTLNELIKYAREYHWKIIVVNDGSTDGTGEILNHYEDIIIINHKNNKGYGASLKTGIRNATTAYIATYDSDGQHNPLDLKNLADNIGDYDMLVGKRGKDSHQVFFRKPGKWIIKIIANFLTKQKIPDINSGLRIIKRQVIKDKLNLFSDSFSFSTTSTVGLINLGYYVGFSPIIVNKRVGKSTVRQLKHGNETLLLILRLIMLFNPLRIFIPASFTLFCIGLIYELFWGILLIDKIKLVSGALFLIITSVIIFLIGLIADQIAEIRKRLLNNE